MYIYIYRTPPAYFLGLSDQIAVRPGARPSIYLSISISINMCISLYTYPRFTPPPCIISRTAQLDCCASWHSTALVTGRRARVRGLIPPIGTG